MGLLIFFALFISYLICMAPGLTFGDSGELASAAFTLGIAHPPGYPGYVILGRLFSLLPLGSIAFRLNLLSAFFTALSGLFIFKGLKNIKVPCAAAFLSTLLFCFSDSVFSTALVTEVYGLNIFWFSLFFYFFTFPVNIKTLMLTALVSGLAASNHHTALALVPVWASAGFYFSFYGRVYRGLNFSLSGLKGYICIWASFITGLLPYAMMPLISINDPLMNWGRPQTLSSWLHCVTRAQYGGFDKTERTWENIKSSWHWFFSLEQFRPFFIFFLLLLIPLFAVLITIFLKNKININNINKSIEDKGNINNSNEYNSNEYKSNKICNKICNKIRNKNRGREDAGIKIDTNQSRRIFYFTIWLVIVFSIGLLWLLMPVDKGTMVRTVQFYMPFFMALVILPWLFMVRLMSGEIDFFKGPAGKIFILGLAGLVAFTVFWRISWGSRADDAYAVRFAGDVNLSLFGGFKDAYAGPLCENRPRKKRILFLDHDDNYFPLIYEQICRGKYNDLIPVCSQFLVLKWYFVELSQRYPFLNMTLFKDELSDPKSIVKRRIRDIIMSNPELEISCLLNNEPLFPEEIKLVPCGLVFNLLKHRQELSGINRVLNFDFSGFANFEDNLSGLLIKPHLFFDPASFQALRYYALAAVNMGIFAVSEDEPFRGYEFLCHTDRLFSFLSASVQGQVFFLKGKALLLSKKYDSAAQFLSRALEFGQADEKGEIFFLRGLAFMGLKHKDHAVRDFGRAKKAGKTLLPHIIDYMGSNP